MSPTFDPDPDDPKYIRLRDSYPDVLTRRFEATKIKLGDLLGQLVQGERNAVGDFSVTGSSTLAPLAEIY